MEGNAFCSTCKIRHVECFCICSSLPFLCSTCQSLHLTKPDFHFLLPFEAYGPINLSNQLQYRMWLLTLKNSQDQLRANLHSINQCKSDIQTHSENLQREIAKVTNAALDSLEALKEVINFEIEQAIRETTVNAYRPEYRPETYLTRVIWSHCYCQRSNSVPVFAYKIHMNENFEEFFGVKFQTAIPELDKFNYRSQIGNSEFRNEFQKIERLFIEENHRKNGIFQPSHQLVHLTPHFFRFFDFQKSVWEAGVNLSEEIQVNGNSRWVILEDGSVFCCGGGKYCGGVWKTVYVVQGSGVVERKADMNIERFAHGVIEVQGSIYVFGDYGKSYPGTGFSPLNSCEKFELLRNSWRLLPDMHQGRAFFNPCLFRLLIYLCGAGSSTIEVFSPSTDSFLAIQIEIPMLQYACCMYVDGEELVVHFNDRVHRYGGGGDGGLVPVTQVATPVVNKLQNSQPVVDREKRVFYVVKGAECVGFDMHTGVQVCKIA